MATEPQDEEPATDKRSKGARILVHFQNAIHEAGLTHVVQGLGRTNKAGHELIVRDPHGVVKTVSVPHNKEPDEIGVRVLSAFEKPKKRPKTGPKRISRGLCSSFGDGSDF